MIRIAKIFFGSLLREFIVALPDEFTKVRRRYYNKRGCQINCQASLAPNVRIRGVLELGPGSSIAQNCSISGMSAGVYIGENVMIAPNVVIVAFDHGTADIEMPMKHQLNIEAPVYIEDDVWIAANTTIAKGVRIGKGSIIGANSFVNKDVLPYSVATGTPARVIKRRNKL